MPRSKGEIELMVIGGAEIYKEALANADRIYLVSRLNLRDRLIPIFQNLMKRDWKVISEIKHSGDSIPWTFKVIER